jgi:RND family efflux transporter MFP subunit
MKARNIIPIVSLAFAALVITGCGHEEPKTAGANLESLTVKTAEVQLVTTMKPIEVRGVVQPARQAAVSSRVMGPVVALRVSSGSVVSKGQTLLEIQPEASQGQLAQAQGALAQAEAALALAERNHERYKALHAENAASDLELDMARMQYEKARGAVSQAEGAVRAASSVADESSVKAPFSARVIDTLVEVGDLAAPGRPLVQVESLEDQQIWLTVRARDAGRVQVGDEIAVRFDARPDLGTVTGVVEEIVPSADPATHTLTVKVGLGDVAIPSGFTGRATIDGDAAERLVVPAQALHSRGGLELVVVRSDDGTARTRAVTSGAAAGEGLIEILSGLNAGESIVLDAPGPVADGTPLELAR